MAVGERGQTITMAVFHNPTSGLEPHPFVEADVGALRAAQVHPLGDPFDSRLPPQPGRNRQFGRITIAAVGQVLLVPA